MEEAAKYPDNNMPDENWLLKTNSDFELFRRTRVPLLSRGDINTKAVHASQDSDTDALAQWSKNLKLGVESFPEFKGHIEKWLPFKRKFMATAKTHELDIIFEKPQMIRTPLFFLLECVHFKKKTSGLHCP